MLISATGRNDQKKLGAVFLALFALLLSSAGCTTSGMQGSEEEDAEFSDEVPVEDAATDEVAVEDNAETPPPPADEPSGDVEQASAEEIAPPPESEVAEASAAVEPVAQASEPVPATPPATETPAAGLGGTEDYVVAAGDTLMKIAFQRYGDIFQWKKIASDNADHLKDPNVLPVGMKLKVEAATVASASGEGERYLIKKGDTLGSISGSVYGTPKKWKRIWENNKNLIKNPDRIFSGFYLSYLFSDQDRQEKEQFQTQGAGNALGAAPAAPAAERMPASAPVTGK